MTAANKRIEGNRQIIKSIMKGGENLIKVNGKEIEYTSGMTVQDLLISLSYSTSRIAVERLGEIIPKKNYANTLINDGDKIEIVCFMGGG